MENAKTLDEREYLIAGSVVTYNPDWQALASLISRLTTQVDMIFLIDNATEKYSVECLPEMHPKLTVIRLNENLGVASAHNVAIKRAEEAGCSHIVLFDQDSLPDDDMVSTLIDAERKLRRENCLIAAIGPKYYDPRHLRSAPFICLDGIKISKHYCCGEGEIVEVSYLITSGALISLDSIRKVGPMDDSLFIDYVDIEWCLRAQSMGYKSYGVCAAGMRHCLGDEVIRWGRRTVSIRSPLRNYYLFRNAVLLYRRSYIPVAWSANDAIRLILKLGFFTLITPPRAENLFMMLRGIWHGLLRRNGRYCG